GGQNLIGPELREMLGVLRTQELLMARQIDGGRQLFARANDFGFSKTPEETLRIWDENAVLADVVQAVRMTRPDVIVNRFYHDKKYETHGHHTASAMLALRAFELSNDPKAYAEQVSFFAPWQPRRIFFNTSWWFYGSQEAFDKADKANLYSLDIGAYLPLLGKSNTEIAAEARSMHRCQGFGALSVRGGSLDWFEWLAGDRPAVKDDIFDGINTSWSRIPGGEPIGRMLADADRDYRGDNPAASVPLLLRIRAQIAALPDDGYWKSRKLSEVDEVIQACLGLYLEVVAAAPEAAPGEPVSLAFEAVNRSNVPVVLEQISLTPALWDSVLRAPLFENQPWALSKKMVRLPADMPFSSSFWLTGEATEGLYEVKDLLLRNLPEAPRPLRARWQFRIGEAQLTYETAVAYKEREPSFGEVWRPFDVLPPVSVAFDENAYLMTGASREISLKVRAGVDNLTCKPGIEAPAGWRVELLSDPIVVLRRKGEAQEARFRVTAPPAPAQAELKAYVEVEGKRHTFSLSQIRYDHIPTQQVLTHARARIARAEIKTSAKQIGYYMGAGDEVPAALRQMGCKVTLLDDADLKRARLREFDAVVLGIRAYNTHKSLKFAQPELDAYVRDGGTLVAQYNTSMDLAADGLTPLPFKITRARVTDERAEVRILQPGHKALNKPNRITQVDFEGWVQERGLYFVADWHADFVAPLSMSDPDEAPISGALIIAQIGKGHYVYTGLSFFRQLPAGVPGAARLFANLLSLSKT
ncbi:MAG: LmbE family protein, partial [Saprospiraceae bacterium]